MPAAPQPTRPRAPSTSSATVKLPPLARHCASPWPPACRPAPEVAPGASCCPPAHNFGLLHPPALPLQPEPPPLQAAPPPPPSSPRAVSPPPCQPSGRLPQRPASTSAFLKDARELVKGEQACSHEVERRLEKKQAPRKERNLKKSNKIQKRKANGRKACLTLAVTSQSLGRAVLYRRQAATGV